VTLDARPRTHRDGARSCYVSDPDGNKIQIIHHPPISGKG
jgi:catechol 2,3-dioxygenase-like lactoylglutathione lyase family enzyme